jgi:hypothetical protein
MEVFMDYQPPEQTRISIPQLNLSVINGGQGQS